MKTNQLQSILLLPALAGLIFISCQDKSTKPFPIITRISPDSGVVGSFVEIQGNNFFDPVAAHTSPVLNTTVVKFNGITAHVGSGYQDGIGKQRIITTVPVGATSGRITITTNGGSTSSLDDFTLRSAYVPNVTVSTVQNYRSRGITVDADGNFYLATSYYYYWNGDTASVSKISPNGTVSTLLYLHDYEFADFGIAVDVNGNVYAAVLEEIKKIAPNGIVSTLAGSHYGYNDGPGTSAKFGDPYGVAVDASGNVYVADMGNHKIRKITPDGTVSTLAGSSKGYADGLGANARFNSPAGIAVDRAGNVLVTDWLNDKIRKITPDGFVTTVAGTTKGYNDGPAALAQFNQPNGIAVDGNGIIYVADGYNFVIRRITPDGTVSTVAGSTCGYSDGSGTTAKFGAISGIALSASNNIIYATDPDNHNIRKIVIN